MKKQVMFTRVLCSLLAIALLLGGVPASALVGNLYSEGLDVSSAFELDGEFVSRSASTGAKAAPGDDVPKFDLDVEQTKEIMPVLSESVPIASTASVNSRAIGQLNIGQQPCGNVVLPLGQDETHILTFELEYDTLLFSKMTSDNSGYAYQIFSITESGSLEGYSGAVLAGNSINGMIPAGRYAFVVVNVAGDTYGDDYKLFVNSATPEHIGASGYKVIRLSSAYDQITVMYVSYLENDSEPKKTVYVDGARAIDETSEEDYLEWERRLELNWGSGYNSNWHHIFEAKVDSLSGPVKYTSDYVSSDYAVLLYLDVGTGFTYNESKRNWNTGESYYTHMDILNKRTPRRLDAEDIAECHCVLVFDLVTEKPIDFWSKLNMYYGTGTEHAEYEEY